MARAKYIVEIANRVGKSAATVERHKSEGMWPLDPLTDLDRHYGVMDACGLGSGRDNWAVAVDAAVQFGWATVKLRSVIVEPPPIDGSSLMARVRALVVQFVLASGILDDHQDEKAHDTEAYLRDQTTGKVVVDQTTHKVVVDQITGKKINEAVPVRRETHDDLVNGVADDMRGAVEEVVQGRETTGEDFKSMAGVVTSISDRLIESGVPDNVDEEPARAAEDDAQAVVVGSVQRMLGWREWAERASATELVDAAALSAKVVDLLNRKKLGESRSDDERRQIAYLTAWCGAELVPIGFDQQLPALGSVLLPQATDRPADSLSAPQSSEPATDGAEMIKTGNGGAVRSVPDIGTSAILLEEWQKAQEPHNNK